MPSLGTRRVNDRGHLEIGGCDTVELAERFGTPLYVFDEVLLRETCREFHAAFRKAGLRYQVAYAGKAFCTQAMCRLVEEEGLHLDVVSAGELHTALTAGFPPEKIHLHGNNKSRDELIYGLRAGIGGFVVDNFYELDLLAELAERQGKRPNILLRVTPGVEAHTHEYIQTGQQDTKFGFDLASGQAEAAVRRAQRARGVNLVGLHCHIGSQIFETEGFVLAVERMMEFYARAVNEWGASLRILNVGGGFGIRYVEEDRPLPVEAYIAAIADAVKGEALRRGVAVPEVWVEPGRRIAGPAGTTLYTVGARKEIPGVRRYIAVDGGMADNPRPIIYQARYEAVVANRAGEPVEELAAVAGKFCETGDMLIWDTPLARAVPGDILAVFGTGAYTYSMASNYNRAPRPAVVFVRDGRADVVVRRETLDDLIRLDQIPERMRKEQHPVS
ncbi:diaminopimelate decarboxylase [Kyrpidia tusciae]|uniref:Diaminopimelate decarboxylase n=1 Tax=Kyrpidia tusciae (strain DSM 2912 / NBRC 15312 / T2) TaxID=562970 RepID=D5WQB9_KYRT2|nr:diaminopimelate decarboxylase [Kyrpidia tusciae]ADG06528.1 diaminopimelate decarboxylase [Kyrpidia tusciae DSM 2912]